MRPAHYAREVQGAEPAAARRGGASMRPAHYAREVLGAGRSPRSAESRFNEARALCAGSQAPLTAPSSWRLMLQ